VRVYWFARTSPPVAVPLARHVTGVILWFTNRTLASPRATFTPPLCRLRAKNIVGFAVSETAHGMFRSGWLLQ
jgi:hypothetical protein